MGIVELSFIPAISRRPSRCCVLVGLGLLTVGAGCNWWLRITEVQGTVRVKGAPAAGVQVVFEPLAEDLPRAVARTNNEGVYRLGRQGPGRNSGAAAGRYRVQVLSDTEREEPIVIPPEFNASSTLEFAVVPGKTNVFDIDIPGT